MCARNHQEGWPGKEGDKDKEEAGEDQEEDGERKKREKEGNKEEPNGRGTTHRCTLPTRQPHCKRIWSTEHHQEARRAEAPGEHIRQVKNKREVVGTERREDAWKAFGNLHRGNLMLRSLFVS